MYDLLVRGGTVVTPVSSEPQAEAEGPKAVDYGLHAILAGDISLEVMEEIGTSSGAVSPRSRRR